MPVPENTLGSQGAIASAERLRLILDSALDAIVTIDAQGRVIDWNQRAHVLFGWSAEEALGKSMTELFIPPRYREAHDRGMRHFLASGEGPILNRRMELPAIHRDGREFPVELTVAPAKVGEGWIFSAFIRDLSETKAAADRLKLQYAVTSILSDAEGLPQAAPELLQAIFRFTPWEVACLWIPDAADGTRISCLVTASKSPWDTLETFIAETRMFRFASGEGLPGKVWADGKHHWIEDFRASEGFPRRAFAIAAGLQSGLAFPIMAGDRFHGVIELFSREPLRLEGEILKGLLSSGSQIGQFIERRRAQSSLQRREKELTDFVENATVGMHWVGPDGVILWVNKYELELLGYSREEYVGHHIAEFHADGPVITDILRRLASKEELDNYEARLRCKDGSIRHVLISSSVRWEEERFIHTRCFTRDITERKHSLDALQESESRFRNMADSAPVLIWMSGTDALCNYFNKTWLEFRGRTLPEESGNGWAAGIHPDDFRRCMDAYLAAFSARNPFRMEFRLQRGDGEYRWLLQTGTPRFGPDGAFAGYIGSCIDIGDMKEAEAQFRQAQKMEAVGLLAGGIAHDFNNLLTAINGYTDLAFSQVQGNETLREFLEEIKKSGERAASLTQQLLAYSRKQILAPVIFNVNSTVAEMDRMLRRLIGEDIELVTALDPDLGLVRADPGQIQQIILNLALNARDAMPKGGRLTLETANVILDRNYISTRLDAKPGPHIMLAVSDTGLGMTPEVKARIFEPFFTTKEVGKGTGLGLSSVYGIIKQSEGSILVYTEPGQGTTFKIYLPLVEAKDHAASAASPQDGPRNTGTERILLVEDEQAVRKFINRALSASGYTVLEAKDGKEALGLAQSGQTVDLVLTDVVMPAMNGRQLASQLTALFPGIPVLFMSGYTDNAIVHHGVLDPDAAFLQKPFSQADLLRKIREALDRKILHH